MSWRSSPGFVTSRPAQRLLTLAEAEGIPLLTLTAGLTDDPVTHLLVVEAVRAHAVALEAKAKREEAAWAEAEARMAEAVSR